MKNNFTVPAVCRHSFYILKYGLFLIVSMLGATWLKYDLTICSSNEESIRFFTAAPLARLMLEHTLITLIIIIAGALALDLIVKNKDKI